MKKFASKLVKNNEFLFEISKLVKEHYKDDENFVEMKRIFTERKEMYQTERMKDIISTKKLLGDLVIGLY